ncbi:glycosyltransferase family 2 protein [Streptococcus cuniculipharyngis]|uniref:Glycosyltransferase family 2 protein n=1 Tax=Streptococcus cuniculipharyngis TaxID=1562651 RepID=A0A5C5SGC3_9STRE|nr:glycosyltransferase family 2 protein [Streptococcus cuniculipharyngis]TWS98961.1 glycosyltransferase family 2 protein [Streptococcus cuniculipharyngis]
MKVNILMATYNGERFLAEQIESIRQQTFDNWQLLIRDDGSSDATRQIIQDFVAQDNRIRFVNPDTIENIGVINSFHTLLKQEQADFYFFSDQDDVWLPEKLSLCLETAQAYEPDRPLLVYTDLSVVDDGLNLITQSMIKSQSHHANTSLRQELTENTVTGGTMMINHALAEKWSQTDGLLMHDWYLALLASGLGQLVYLDVPTELYRQHDANVLGARTWSKRMKNWLRPHQLVEKYWWLIKASQKQANYLLQERLSSADRDLVSAYVTLLDQPFLERIKILHKYKLAKNRWFHTLVFRSLIISKFGYRRN